MSLLLHTSDKPSDLRKIYEMAFNEAAEIYVVSAYLTDWDGAVKPLTRGVRFRFIIGKDFGITRKDACRNVMRWLPAARKAEFLVADAITGFHPKAVIWKTVDEKSFILIGSSNLSKAAFERNVEANVFAPISQQEFEEAKEWVEWIADRSVPVSEDWLDQYVEARPNPVRGHKVAASSSAEKSSPIVVFDLPLPERASERLSARREQLAAYERHREDLMRLFRKVANGRIDSARFFEELPRHWGFENGNRLQGLGWERTGKGADFQELAQSLLTIVDASAGERDDVVREEIDRLHDSGNPARRAFLSEMLCLRFPREYPVLNGPVREFLVRNRFGAPHKSSEGAKYVDLAKKLRAALRADPAFPAKNLAELDVLIWASSEYNPRAE